MEEYGHERSSETWSRIASRRLRQRWVQVALTVGAGLLIMALSVFVLAPKRVPRPKDPKYIFCPKCEYETRYEAKLDGEPCPKCPEDPVGTLIGRDVSIKEVAQKSPWKWVYLSIALEAIATTGVVVYLLNRTGGSSATIYYVFRCPHCGQRLRFRQASLEGLGQCSRCKRPVRFPSEDDAVKEEDLIKEEQERLLSQVEEEDSDEQ
ncbi:MAG: hypothetical protein U0791_11935 [Gemmataceae bacterium]